MILVRPVQAMQRSSLSFAPKCASIAKVTTPAGWGCSCSIVQVDDLWGKKRKGTHACECDLMKAKSWQNLAAVFIFFRVVLYNTPYIQSD
jgi:hypothetical protein